MKKHTKILSMLLAVLMIMSVMPMTAFAETTASGTIEDNITWVIDSDGTLTFSGNGEMYVEYDDIFSDYMNQIKTVIFDEGITKIHFNPNNGFSHFSVLTSMYIPSTLTEIDDGAISSRTIKQYIVDDNSASYCDEDGILYNKEKTKIIAYPAGDPSTEYVVPANITTIGNYAFSMCNNLINVKMSSVQFIGIGAFFNCENIKSIKLPEKVVQISNGAFYACFALEDITVPELLTTIIEAFSYAGCNIKNIVIPEGIETIAYYAFGACYNLESVVIPTSVKSIESHVFNDSDSLTDIYYCGSEEEWNAITIDPDGNENLLNANIHFNTCLHPEEDNDDTNNCSHMCHKSGFVGFIWKIINFLQKLFGTNKYCSCGAAHY